MSYCPQCGIECSYAEPVYYPAIYDENGELIDGDADGVRCTWHAKWNEECQEWIEPPCA